MYRSTSQSIRSSRIKALTFGKKIIEFMERSPACGSQTVSFSFLSVTEVQFLRGIEESSCSVGARISLSALIS
ncbi:hypothetical protein GCM10023310_48210 [Paenibacillus vulneris]